MRRSEIYLKAARLMANGRACKVANCGYPCCAMSSAVSAGGLYDNARGDFIDLFAPASWSPEATIEERDIAVVALLFAHHIARDSE